MKLVEPNKLYRKSGMWGPPMGWLLGQSSKAVVGLRPVFFGPCTLGRTWGTRPIPSELSDYLWPVSL
jgi:hypothetical protein